MPNKHITYVAESGIHGKGLFAAEFIEKDTIIGYLDGEHTQEDGMYVLWLNGETGFEVSCKLKYINHSDQPNACYYDDKSVVALRDIQPNEEITHNYEADCEW
jgi:uncharacterized protein